MAYVDLNTIHNPSTGGVAPAAWGDQIRDNLEFLIDPPTCVAFDASGQTVADSTTTILNADSELFDTDAMHSTVTNNSRITAQTAGRYDVSCRVQFSTDATDGRRTVQFLVNGTTSTTVQSARAVTDGAAHTVTTFMKLVMAAGDYVEVRVFHNAGNNLTVTLQEFSALFITR